MSDEKLWDESPTSRHLQVLYHQTSFKASYRTLHKCCNLLFAQTKILTQLKRRGLGYITESWQYPSITHKPWTKKRAWGTHLCAEINKSACIHNIIAIFLRYNIIILLSKQYNLDVKPHIIIWRQGIQALLQPSFVWITETEHKVFLQTGYHVFLRHTSVLYVHADLAISAQR